MKKFIIILLSVGLLFGLTSCNQGTAENTTVQPQAKPVITGADLAKCWIETPFPIQNWLNLSTKIITQSNSMHKTKTTLYLQERPSPTQITTQAKVNIAVTARINSQLLWALVLSLRAFPTMVILNEQLQIMNTLRGYKTPQQLQPLLEQYAKI